MNKEKQTKSATTKSDVLGRWDTPTEKAVVLTVYNVGSGTIILTGDRHSVNHAASCLRNNGVYSYERIEKVTANDGEYPQFALLVRDSVSARHTLTFTLGLVIAS